MFILFWECHFNTYTSWKFSLRKHERICMVEFFARFRECFCIFDACFWLLNWLLKSGFFIPYLMGEVKKVSRKFVVIFFFLATLMINISLDIVISLSLWGSPAGVIITVDRIFYRSWISHQLGQICR